ncbi:hypothetical protein IGI04_024195 [Brassica rapa subsp. trilocularis]|uniref:Uncharacterized protein n=1 Tax=Brassica rapa subsp. trilocularis TaxID=1813537 RepID=A0ABQ7M614_BRACM|nr:hypothetical protein IGI04_024195 [Brassica rapa subsp. trilocularis]
MDQNEIRESLEEEVSELNFPRSPRDSRPRAAAVAGIRFTSFYNLNSKSLYENDKRERHPHSLGHLGCHSDSTQRCSNWRDNRWKHHSVNHCSNNEHFPPCGECC